MPLINFDLEDGKKPVSFTLTGEDSDRFMAFMAECDKYKADLNALAGLIAEAAIRSGIGRPGDSINGLQLVALLDEMVEQIQRGKENPVSWPDVAWIVRWAVNNVAPHIGGINDHLLEKDIDRCHLQLRQRPERHTPRVSLKCG